MLFRRAVAVAVLATVFPATIVAATGTVPASVCKAGACANAAGIKIAATPKRDPVQAVAAPAKPRSAMSGDVALAALLGLLVLAFRFVPRRSALPEVAS